MFNSPRSSMLALTLLTIIESSLSSHDNVPELNLSLATHYNVTEPDPDYVYAKNHLGNICSDTYVEAPWPAACPNTCQKRFPYNFYTEKTKLICYSSIIMGQTAKKTLVGDREKLCECGLRAGEKICRRPYRIVRKKIVPKFKKPDCNNAFDDVAVFVQIAAKRSGNHKEQKIVWCHHNVPDTLRLFKTIDLQWLVTSTRLPNGKVKCWCGLPTEGLLKWKSKLDTPDELPPGYAHELPLIVTSDYKKSLTNSQKSISIIVQEHLAKRISQFSQFGLTSTPSILPRCIPADQPSRNLFPQFVEPTVSQENYQANHLSKIQDLQLGQPLVSGTSSDTITGRNFPAIHSSEIQVPEIGEPPVRKNKVEKTLQRSNNYSENRPSRIQIPFFAQHREQGSTSTTKVQISNPESQPTGNKFPQFTQPPSSGTTSDKIAQENNPVIHPSEMQAPQIGQPPFCQTNITTSQRINHFQNSPKRIQIPSFAQPAGQGNTSTANVQISNPANIPRINPFHQFGQLSVRSPTSTTNKRISNHVDPPMEIQFPQFGQPPASQTARTNRKASFPESHLRKSPLSPFCETSLRRTTSTTNKQINNPADPSMGIQFPQFGQPSVSRETSFPKSHSISTQLSLSSQLSVDEIALTPVQKGNLARDHTGNPSVKNQQDKRPHSSTSIKRTHSPESKRPLKLHQFI